MMGRAGKFPKVALSLYKKIEILNSISSIATNGLNFAPGLIFELFKQKF